MKKILLAEDDPHIARLVQYILSKSGFEVTHAENGVQATQKLDEQEWGLIVLDVMMPLKSGWDVLKIIRETDKYKHLPVLMLTARGNEKDISYAAELGATDYLIKPFEPKSLTDKVQKLIEDGLEN